MLEIHTLYSTTVGLSYYVGQICCFSEREYKLCKFVIVCTGGLGVEFPSAQVCFRARPAHNNGNKTLSIFLICISNCVLQNKNEQRFRPCARPLLGHLYMHKFRPKISPFMPTIKEKKTNNIILHHSQELINMAQQNKFRKRENVLHGNFFRHKTTFR